MSKETRRTESAAVDFTAENESLHQAKEGLDETRPGGVEVCIRLNRPARSSRRRPYISIFTTK
ncbi:MAG: hypothetical protein WBD36_13425 [Bacteroidota bacterium]